MKNSITIKSKTLIWSGNGHVIGWVIEDTLTKNVKASRHLLRKPRGWAWDASAIEEAERLGATQVEIRDQENNDVFYTALENFRSFGVKLDRGFGPQICLPLKYWQVAHLGEVKCLQLSLDW